MVLKKSKPMSDIHEQLRDKLSDTSLPLPARFRALFSLRGLGNDKAVDALISGFNDTSALIRHEIAFCLGQMQNETAVSFLTSVLTNLEEHPMVRHEAAEALGAIAAPGCEECLLKYKDDDQQEVRETCRLAIRRIQNQREEKAKEGKVDEAENSDDEAEIDDDNKSGVILVGSSKGGEPAVMSDVLPGSTKEQMALAALKEYGGSQENVVMSGCTSQDTMFLSVDPAPARKDEDLSSAQLREILLQEDGDMFERYSALFTLRNRGNPEDVQALTDSFNCSSALLKHEVAYVLGQLQKELAVDTLAKVLDDTNENPMVRHEAAEALGSIAIERCTELLKKHLTDPEPIVSESCLVALDILEYETSGNLHYADMDPSSSVSSYGSLNGAGLEAQSVQAH